MQFTLRLLCIFSIIVPTLRAQTVAAENKTAVGSTSMTSILPDLDRLQQAASQTNLDLGHMRIEKWKADNGSKQQAQANADSIQRNLTAALPGLISDVRSSPQDIGAEFRLYRNLDALYDVLASLTESTGAFGSKSDFDTLAQQLSIFDSARHNLGNSLEGLATSTESELVQLRAQVRTMQQAAAPAPPPKKVIVDDNEPVKKTTAHKKKPAAKPATNGGPTSSGSSADSSGSGTSTAKQQ
jgi:hypothetical protein